jgi:hypothetical protein
MPRRRLARSRCSNTSNDSACLAKKLLIFGSPATPDVPLTIIPDPFFAYAPSGSDGDRGPMTVGPIYRRERVCRLQ